MKHSDAHELNETLLAMAKAMPGGMAQVAGDLDVTLATLRTEISNLASPEGAITRNKLGAARLIEFMDECGPLPVLEWMARRWLLDGIPAAAQVPGEPLHVLMTRIAEKAGDVAQALREGTAPGSPGGRRLVGEERPRLMGEIDGLKTVLALMVLATGAEPDVVVHLAERAARKK